MMRFGPDDKFWLVTDPTPESEAEDIVFQPRTHAQAIRAMGRRKARSRRLSAP